MVDALSLEIFFVFLKTSLISFGGVFGVLPYLEKMIVSEHHWLTHAQFIQSFVLAQFVPGPNMVMCSMIGYQIHGWPGFIAGFLGIYTLPVVFMGGAFCFYSRYRNIRCVRKIELSLRPLVVGLITASALQMWWTQSSTLYASKIFSLFVAATLTLIGTKLCYSRKLGPTALLASCGLLAWGARWLLVGG